MSGGDRPFINATIDELEKLFSEKKSDRAVLGRIREELTYRTTRRAKQLMREVKGVSDGEVPVTKEVRPDRQEDQLGLLGADD